LLRFPIPDSLLGASGSQGDIQKVEEQPWDPISIVLLGANEVLPILVLNVANEVVLQNKQNSVIRNSRMKGLSFVGQPGAHSKKGATAVARLIASIFSFPLSRVAFTGFFLKRISFGSFFPFSCSQRFFCLPVSCFRLSPFTPNLSLGFVL